MVPVLFLDCSTTSRRPKVTKRVLFVAAGLSGRLAFTNELPSMSSLTSLRPTQSSPLSFEGHGGLRAQQAESDLRLLRKREWWLWFSALSVTVLSAAGFVLSSFQRLFSHTDHFYEIRSDQARWAILSLLLLFNVWTAYRQWSFRRMRSQFRTDENPSDETPKALEDPSGLDPVTSLYTRASIELHLGKEIAHARRQNTSLTLAALHLDDLEQLASRAGKTATDELLKEFARRLKEASRGSDFAARIASDAFLLVLPKCTLNEARVVLDRVGVVEIKASGQKMVLAYTSGWVDYQPGDLPSDLLRRATDILQLYKNASQDALSSALAAS
jgi:diguanylate cyclase (GGDEF)-like protein